MVNISFSKHGFSLRKPSNSRPGAAVRTVIAVFGVLAGLAGVEHGVGEILQGRVSPPGPVIRSWTEHGAFDVLGGEPALTVLPNLLVSGIVTVLVGTGLAVWSVAGMQRRRGALMLIGLSLLLLAVGGGFGPPLLGVILGVGASRLITPSRRPRRVTRTLATVLPWALCAGVVGYLGLVPGTLILQVLWGPPPPAVVYGFIVLAFGGMVFALLAARASERIQGWRDDVPGSRVHGGSDEVPLD